MDNKLIELLDRHERARFESFQHSDAQRRFLAGAALLRVVAAQELGTSPSEVNVDRKCERCADWHGRPRLPGADLEVSVSHSGDMAVVATCWNCPVGVDVEQLRPIEYSSLLAVIAHADEIDGVGAGPQFFRLWTRKEAVLKATGDGISADMRAVVLTPANEAPSLVRYSSRPGVAATLQDIYIAPGYAAAVAVLKDTPLLLKVRDGSSLLFATTNGERSRQDLAAGGGAR